MAEEKMFTIDIGQEVEKFFKDDSIATGREPVFVLILGGVAAGKTTIRKQQYSCGYVVLDASDIFLSLSQGEFFDFGHAFQEPLEILGGLIAQRAIREKRNLVTEMIGDSVDDTKAVIEAMKSQSYKVEVIGVTCDIEEAQRRNLNRTEDSISSYYTQEYHSRWILEAVDPVEGA